MVVAMLIAVPLTLALPSALATSHSPSTAVGPELEVQPTRLSYAAGERVTLEVTNHGDTVNGTAKLEIWWACEPDHDCEERSVHLKDQVGPETFSFPSGETIPYHWDRNGFTAPEGTYWATLTFTTSDGQTYEYRSTNFTLTDEGVEDGPPFIAVKSPQHGATYQDRAVTVHVVVEDDHLVDNVAIWLDGHLLAHRDGIGDARYEYLQDHELPPGDHELHVNATDDSGHMSRSSVGFTVAGDQQPVRLTVRTDRFSYGPDEPVEILVRNDNDVAVEGTPYMTVRTSNGAVVWSPAVAQVIETLEPGEERRYTWDQRTNEGDPAPRGEYIVTVRWGNGRGHTGFALEGDSQDFRITIVRPEPGAGHRGKVGFQVQVGQPGADRIHLQVRNGAGTFERSQSFPSPVTGLVEHTVDLSGAAPGSYKAAVRAQGPGGSAEAVTWFRLLPAEDDRAPEVEILHPQEGERVLRTFPVVFEATDDTGIGYAEAYLGEKLVGRQAWPYPVQRGAMPVHLPPGTAGDQRLEVVVYDQGRHSDSETVGITVLPDARPCTEVRSQARVLVNATMVQDRSPNATIQATANASAGSGFLFDCPNRERPEGDGERVTRGSFGYTRDARGTVVDLEVRGQRVFERVGAEDHGEPSSFDLETKGRFMVLKAHLAGNVTTDLNGTWVVTQRGQHILLENTEDGSRILVVMKGATPNLQGHRLVASMNVESRMIVRSLGDDAVEDELVEGIIQGRVGAEVAVSASQEDTETVSYGDLNVTVHQRDRQVAATLSSERHQGRTLVFTLDPNASIGAEIDVLLDGEPVRKAASLQDVLDQADPDQPSEYYVVQADGETKVIVQINHFSTRELVIQAAAIAAPFLTPLALFGGLAVVGIATFAMFRRPRA